ncbi:MAG: hypothetical protein HC906_04415 [Bacteroidales bacterium]|nr:hypothetical protein [Bacteroidales bacterium]
MSDNNIRVVFADKEENIWVGTQYGGLNLYNRKMMISSASSTIL